MILVVEIFSISVHYGIVTPSDLHPVRSSTALRISLMLEAVRRNIFGCTRVGENKTQKVTIARLTLPCPSP